MTTTTAVTKQPTEQPQAFGAVDAIVDEMRKAQKQRRRIPFKAWRRQYAKLLFEEEQAFNEMYAQYSRNEKGILMEPLPDTPEHAAKQRVYREQVIPAMRAHREFCDNTMYYVKEDERYAVQERRGRRQEGGNPQEKDENPSARRTQVLEALQANNGCSKAQLYRATGAKNKRDKQAVEGMFRALCDEGICQWEQPERAGLSGKCQLITPDVEAERVR